MATSGNPGINNSSNGLTLCRNCHQAFDNSLVCISRDDFTLLVADALQHEESEKWKPLHGKHITFWTYYIIINPGKKVLAYRLEEFNTKAKEINKNRNAFPYHCTSCNYWDSNNSLGRKNVLTNLEKEFILNSCDKYWYFITYDEEEH